MFGAGKGMRWWGVAAIGLLLAGPLAADVKDGVDAWGSGDYEAAVREWIEPARAGDPDAQFNLAQAYRLGRGVDTDLARAEELYAQAAAQGHLRAADNYGILLFQNDKREQAMPYIAAAARRGDPRAQYLQGLAHFNGDLAQKDWPRAYALLTLANSVGLPQARRALVQMDQYIPLAERQAAQTLASRLKAEAEAARARELAAVTLAVGTETGPQAKDAAGAARAVAQPRPAPAVVARQPAETPRAVNVARGEPAAEEISVLSDRPERARNPGTASRTGPWKVQLGAFGVPANVERMWGKVSALSAFAGTRKVTVSTGRVTILQAGGFATRDAANAACSALKRDGGDCIVVR